MPTLLTPDINVSPRYRIADLEVDVGKALVTRRGETIALPKLSFDLLRTLIEAAPAIVTNEELLRRVWPGLMVNPESVAQRVKLLRSAIGDDSQRPRYILGVRSRGYRLIPVPERLANSRGTSTAAVSDGVSNTGADQAEPIPGHAFPAGQPSKYLRRIGLGIAALVAVGGAVLGLYYRSPGHQTGPFASATTMGKSIAVLPFVDLSEGRDQEYFADGTAESIIDLLAKIPALKVIGRTSSFQFKGKTEDLRSIGSKLGASYLLQGSVRKTGDRLRVTAQLIDSRDGAELLSQTYDRELNDVFKVQDEIAVALVRALQIQVGADGFAGRPALRDSQAYSLYLQGRYALDRDDERGFERAVSFFQRALELDPSFAEAAVGLVAAYTQLGETEPGAMPSALAFAHAREAAELAVKLDPNLPSAHAALASLPDLDRWDWTLADRELHTALAFAPEDPHILALAARQSMFLGRSDDALKLVNASLQRDPLNPYTYWLLKDVQLRRGRLADAEAAARRVIEISSTSEDEHYSLGLVLLARGEAKAALDEMLKETDPGVRASGLAMTYFALGRKSDSDAALDQLVRNKVFHDSMDIAEVYAFRGELDDAFEWLDRAYSEKVPNLRYVKGDPLFKKLENDPRYTALLKKMNL
jgi:TolB-like protein/DNA-binding winged helix-turn-helix (wHTH) protein/Flp pilus assembly protein TadD